MSVYEVQSDSGRVAKVFLGWEPPIALEVAINRLQKMEFGDGLFRDHELERLTKFWLAKGVRRTLPNFATNVRATVRLLKEHSLRGHMVVTEKLVKEFVTIIYRDQAMTKMIGSGSGRTESASVFDATLSYINNEASTERDLR